MSMTLEQLLRSTENYQGADGKNHYSPSYTFSHKQMGNIYFKNKTVRTKPEHSIIEITMLITGKTEQVKKGGNTSNIAAHRVMMSIRGVRQQVRSTKQIATNMRFAYPQDYGDKEKFSDEELAQRAVSGDVKPFKHSTVLPLENQPGKYVILQDEIPNDAIIRVWCSCSSYFWSFQYYNIKAGANILDSKAAGAASYGAYRYKTKAGFEAFKSGKPMRNPKKVPGMCKHLLLLVALLIQTKTFSESSKETRKTLSKYEMNASKFTKMNHVSQTEYESKMNEFKTDRAEQVNQRKMSFSGLASMSQAWIGYNPKFGKRMY